MLYPFVTNKDNYNLIFLYWLGDCPILFGVIEFLVRSRSLGSPGLSTHAEICSYVIQGLWLHLAWICYLLCISKISTLLAMLKVIFSCGSYIPDIHSQLFSLLSGFSQRWRLLHDQILTQMSHLENQRCAPLISGLTSDRNSEGETYKETWIKITVNIYVSYSLKSCHVELCAAGEKNHIVKWPYCYVCKKTHNTHC